MRIGYWLLGIGDWGLGQINQINPQSPLTNPDPETRSLIREDINRAGILRRVVVQVSVHAFGRASLAAVLDPPATEDIFFVADGTGGHVFASTYEAHVRNVERWRQIEKMRKTQAGLVKPTTPAAVTPPPAAKPKAHEP